MTIQTCQGEIPFFITHIIFFLAVLFMVIGFIVFGSNMDDQSYSFVFCVIAAVMTLIAGILSVLQLLKARH